jgi:hypothetical protein
MNLALNILSAFAGAVIALIVSNFSWLLHAITSFLHVRP